MERGARRTPRWRWRCRRAARSPPQYHGDPIGELQEMPEPELLTVEACDSHNTLKITALGYYSQPAARIRFPFGYYWCVPWIQHTATQTVKQVLVFLSITPGHWSGPWITSPSCMERCAGIASESW